MAQDGWVQCCCCHDHPQAELPSGRDGSVRSASNLGAVLSMQFQCLRASLRGNPSKNAILARTKALLAKLHRGVCLFASPFVPAGPPVNPNMLT